MSKTASSSAALPIAHAALRILIVVNWAMVAVILALLFVLPNEQWIMRAFDLSPSSDAKQLVKGLRAIAALGPRPGNTPTRVPRSTPEKQ